MPRSPEGVPDSEIFGRVLRTIINSIKFSIQIQFGVFLRGHFGTPIDTAPVLLSGILCSASHVWFKSGIAVTSKNANNFT